ncbi:MFS family permease [Catenulispora sp. GP43]|uniref:MFS transporter n=1 Tax=Catenulispora sp. GP43 TaxID=3156263 RepID=UPI0035144A0D
MRELLRHRDIRLLVLARFVDVLGDNVMWIALGIWIKQLTGSSSQAGLSFFVFILGSLLAPAGAVVVDRVRRRPLITILNLVTGLAVLPLLLVHDRSGVWLIYAVMFGYGVLSSVTGAAMTAYTQTLIPAEQLGQANGLLQTVLQGLRLVSPLLGAGVLAAWGIAPLVFGDVATFVLASLLLRAIGTREAAPTPPAEKKRLRGELSAGVRQILGMPILRQATAAAVLCVLAFGLSESVLFAIVDQGLHRKPTFVGVIESFQGLGAIAAGLLAGPLMRRLGESRLIALGMAAAGLGFAACCLPSVAAAGLGVMLVGVSLPWIIAGLMTLFQRTTPPEVMGRTSAALDMMISLPQTTAIAVGAALVAVVDFRVLLGAMTALMGMGSLYLLTRTTTVPEPARTDPVSAPVL